MTDKAMWDGLLEPDETLLWYGRPKRSAGRYALTSRRVLLMNHETVPQPLVVLPLRPGIAVEIVPGHGTSFRFGTKLSVVSSDEGAGGASVGFEEVPDGASLYRLIRQAQLGRPLTAAAADTPPELKSWASFVDPGETAVWSGMPDTERVAPDPRTDLMTAIYTSVAAGAAAALLRVYLADWVVGYRVLLVFAVVATLVFTAILAADKWLRTSNRRDLVASLGRTRYVLTDHRAIEVRDAPDARMRYITLLPSTNMELEEADSTLYFSERREDEITGLVIAFRYLADLNQVSELARSIQAGKE